jgi:hypothetical protein
MAPAGANLGRALIDAAWAPLAVLSGSLVAAFGFDLYRRLHWFDMAMHFAGGMALAYFFKATGMRGRVCFALALVGALAWELAESLADAWLGTRLVHGPADTLRDLLFSALGAACFVTLHALVREQRRI